MTKSLLFFLCLLALPIPHSRAEEEDDGPVGSESTQTKATKLMALTGDNDFADERTAWDRTYSRRDYVFGKDPSDFLVEHVDKLPKGRALDIATGEGRNAVFLAKKGFRVEGVDISVVGLRKAQKLAAENGVKVQTTNADLNKYPIKANSYMAILNFYYLQRSIFPQIKAGLKKGGVVMFENHLVDQLKLPGGNTWEKGFLLEKGELKKAFEDFEILFYQEKNDGKNAVASLIARKK
ncbi:MAG: methyltransferase domain-containing protein [Proteobacteria bacterium]|nr:MAG: methyltransferase domain-containing protein [Pseudomonadota bacterium]